MPKILVPIISALALTFGLSACDDEEVVVETPEGEVEVETDG